VTLLVLHAMLAARPSLLQINSLLMLLLLQIYLRLHSLYSVCVVLYHGSQLPGYVASRPNTTTSGCRAQQRHPLLPAAVLRTVLLLLQQVSLGVLF
jgi:hypothetical protein